MHSIQQLLRRAAPGLTATLAAAVLVACGGGGGTSTGSSSSGQSTPNPPTSSAQSVVEGTITGFGSVVIDGQRIPDTGAKVSFADDPQKLKAATLGDLHTGMRVHAELKDGVLQNLVVNFALVGTVGNISTSASTLTVFGQTIKIQTTGDLPTVFDGFSGLSDLSVGDLVKVSGVVAGDGSITASRIERRQPEAGQLFRLSGAVQGLDSTNKRFSLAGNTGVLIDYSQAKLLPEGAVLENGKLVSLVSTQAPSSSGGQNLLVASAIEIKAKQLPDATNVTVGGAINDFQSLASMRIGDVLVDASAATLSDGTTSADIVNGNQAQAQGALVSGVLKAKTLKVFKPATPVSALLIGQITDFVSLSSFNLRGTTVDASQATFTKGQASDLASGTWVTVKGKLTSNGVKADTIEVQPPPASTPTKLTGTISGLSLDTRKFSLLGTTVTWADGVKFSPDGKTVANLVNGVTVAVEGSYSADTGVFTATSIQVQSTTGATRTLGFSGVIYDITSTSFKIGSYTVTLGGNTVLQPTGTQLADLKNGVRVSVKVTVTGDTAHPTLTAFSIEVEKAETDASGNAYVYLGGLINDFVSSSNFKVGSQAIDASGEVSFVDGDASKLANGAKVEIKGTVVDGVLKAKVVHFMPG
ncbi:DUF5666 domain-containing protein [Burkholderiaceae bacterium UC74_6]